MNAAIHEALSRTAGALSQLLLLAGRQLLEVRRIEGEVQEFGCNSIKHYASCVLGMRGYEAGRLVRVAEKLERLPHLTRELEEGKLSWYQAEVMIDYATPESDEACVRMAGDSNVDDLQRWVRTHGASLNPNKTTEVVVNWTLDMETSLMFERAERKLSEEAGRRLRHKETLQRMSALVLAGRYDEKALAKLREEVELDFLAAQSQAAMSLAQFPEAVPVGAHRCGWKNWRKSNPGLSRGSG